MHYDHRYPRTKSYKNPLVIPNPVDITPYCVNTMTLALEFSFQTTRPAVVVLQLVRIRPMDEVCTRISKNESLCSFCRC